MHDIVLKNEKVDLLAKKKSEKTYLDQNIHIVFHINMLKVC